MTQSVHDIFCDFCRRLVTCCEDSLTKRLPAEDDDHLGFMLATWAPTQLEHLHGIGYLVDNKCFAQAGILARTMLEGFALLYWVKNDVNRATRWRAYSLIHDLRLLREMQQAGKHLDPNQEPELLARLESDAQVFLTKRARELAEKNGLRSVVGDPDNYQDVWHIDSDGTRYSVSSILAKELGDQRLKELYGHFSLHVHWGVNGIARYLRRTPTGYEFNTRAAPQDALSAMAMGFQACIQTFILLAVHFELSDELAALGQLKDDYVATLTSRVPAS